MILGVKNCVILIREYQEAIDFYIGKLGLEVFQEYKGQKGILLVVPGKQDFFISLMKVQEEESLARVGRQTSPYPVFSLETDDCKDEYENWKRKGVFFEGGVQYSPTGNFAVARDLYGNRIFLTDSKFF